MWKKFGTPSNCACALPTGTSSATATTASAAATRLHARIGGRLRVEIGLEVLGGAEPHGAGDEHNRESLLRRVVVAHGAVVIAPGERQVFFERRQLRLQLLKVRVGLQVGVRLGDREQRPDRALN